MQVTAVLVYMHLFLQPTRLSTILFQPTHGCSIDQDRLFDKASDKHYKQSVHASQGCCCTAATASRRSALVSPRCCCSAAC